MNIWACRQLEMEEEEEENQRIQVVELTMETDVKEKMRERVENRRERVWAVRFLFVG